MLKIEKQAYLITIFGVLADQISTRIGLMNPRIYEANVFSRMLMDAKLWLPFDIILIVGTIFISMWILRNWKFKDRYAILTFFIVFGTLRFVASIHNFWMFLGTI